MTRLYSSWSRADRKAANERSSAGARQREWYGEQDTRAARELCDQEGPSHESCGQQCWKLSE